MTYQNIEDILNKLKRLIKKNLLVTLAATVVTLNQGYQLSQGLYYKYNWKEVEQSKIDRIVPTTSIRYIEGILGQPEIESTIDEFLGINIYKEREYWVSAVYEKKSYETLIVSFTACDSFRPHFNNNPTGKTIKLGETKMSDNGDEVAQFYFLSGATAPSYFFEKFYHGNPSRYQSVYIGISEICALGDALQYTALTNISNIDELVETLDGPIDFSRYPYTFYPKSDPSISELRDKVPINTYSITSPKLNDQYERIIEDGIYFAGPPDDLVRIF